MIVIGIWPTEIITGCSDMKFFSRQFNALFPREPIRPQDVERVAPVHDEIQPIGVVIPFECHDVTRTGHVTLAIAHLLLLLFIGREPPDASGPFQLRAWV